MLIAFFSTINFIKMNSSRRKKKPCQQPPNMMYAEMSNGANSIKFPFIRKPHKFLNE